ncbi:MAG TPA: hypothetical protein VMS17_05240 [Gemmataceae bacterium]|nr:hypothetical protein [Gemmataceae bacterium]
MHYPMLVTLALEAGATSLDARSAALSQLQSDPSFCGEGGRFGSPVCDWFVIGGRWSGLLAEQPLGQDYQDAFRAEFPQIAEGGYPATLINKHRAGLNGLWRRFGGREDHPATRSNYRPLGYDDDAMLIDRIRYESFLKPFIGSDAEDNFEFADLDSEPVAESFIGRKWLVVIDFHD